MDSAEILDAQGGLALTIVIVNWNGGELLLRCLGTIRASQTTFPVKVIVVDNNSADGSRERAESEFPEFTVINSGANLGFGRGNNQARPLVDTPLVLFLNPDTELRPDTLQRVVTCLESHPDVALLGCKMLYPDGTVQEQGLQWTTTPGTVFLELLLPEEIRRGWIKRWLPTFDPMVSGGVRKLYGGFLLARRDVLDRAGWFDERYFMYAEDADLSRTIRDLGWKLYYCADTEIVHVCGGASERTPSTFSILMKQRSINQLIRKYNGPGAAVRHRIAVASAAGIRLMVMAIVWPVVRLLKRSSDNRQYAAWWRGRLLMQWALGFKRAPVPERPKSLIALAIGTKRRKAFSS
jgi:hypothetical protein